MNRRSREHQPVHILVIGLISLGIGAMVIAFTCGWMLPDPSGAHDFEAV